MLSISSRCIYHWVLPRIRYLTIATEFLAFIILEVIRMLRCSTWMAPRVRMNYLAGRDFTSMRLFSKVAFCCVCWFLVFYYIPSFLLCSAGFIGAGVCCLWKVIGCACHIAGEIKDMLVKAADEDDASSLTFVALTREDIGPRARTAKQRRLGKYKVREGHCSTGFRKCRWMIS